jgi:hypothetical protein
VQTLKNTTQRPTMVLQSLLMMGLNEASAVELVIGLRV